jgi:hypothetical protein
VSRFVTSFGDSGSAAAPLPRPGTVDVPSGGAGSDLDRYEPLRPGMSDAEIKAAIERARARARDGGSAAGSPEHSAGSADRGDRSGPDAPAPSPPAR